MSSADTSLYLSPNSVLPDAPPEVAHDAFTDDELRFIAKIQGRVKYLDSGTRNRDRHNRLEIEVLRRVLGDVLGVEVPPPPADGPREPSVYWRTAPPPPFDNGNGSNGGGK
jgi:hypothetical protein